MDDKLEKIVASIQSKQRWFQERDAYASGNNPTIYQERPKPAPDFRISVPFAKKAIQQYSGYMVKPGAIAYTGETYESVLRDIYDYNDEQIVTMLEFVDACKFGVTYELHWTEEDGKKHYFYPIKPSQGYPVYDNSLKPKLIGFYWYRQIEGEDVVTFWDDKEQVEYKRQGGELKEESRVPHGYGVVPINIGYIAHDKSNLFDHYKELIDFYDKLISGDVANESQKYANAILLLADRIDDQTTDETGRTMLDRLREIMVLDTLGDGVDKKASYLVKNIPTDFIEFACNKIYDLIHDMGPIIDQRDDKMGTASGVAQEYRLLPFEYKCADIEANFSRFLYARIYMISGVYSRLNTQSSAFKVQIKFSRNLPKNLKEIAEIAGATEGVLSERTRLRLFPSDIVPDVEEELKMLEDERPEESFDTDQST